MKQKQNKTNTPDKKNSIKYYSFDKEKKENLDEISSLNYFKIKGMEKEKNYPENNRKEINPEYRNLTEKIYSSNLAKLGNYYNNNQKDLLLYGSMIHFLCLRPFPQPLGFCTFAKNSFLCRSR